MYFNNTTDVCSSSKVHLTGEGNIDDLICGLGHHLLDTCVHDVLLSGALEQLILVDGQTSCLVDNVQQVVFGLFLPFTTHPAGTDVLQVLKPFEITDCHTTSIAENVGEEPDSLGEADLLAFDGGGTVGSFNDELALEPVSIVAIDGHFQGSGDEKIAE